MLRICVGISLATPRRSPGSVVEILFAILSASASTTCRRTAISSPAVYWSNDLRQLHNHAQSIEIMRVTLFIWPAQLAQPMQRHGCSRGHPTAARLDQDCPF